MAAKINPKGWLQKTVKNPKAYLELLTKADDEAAYEVWLQDIV